MSDLQSDERACPFCAETIKKAAIRCRWCASDLTPAEETTQPGPDESAAEPTPARGESVPEEAAKVEEAPREKRSLGLGLLSALLLLAIAAVAFAVVRANAAETTGDGVVTSNSARAAAMQRVSESTAKALSYKAETFDADAAAAAKLMTPGMAADYRKALDPVKSDVVKNGIALKATVVATGITRQTEDSVKALVFVNQSTTATGQKQEQLDNNRVVVTMQRKGNQWLISKMDAF